MKEKFEKPTLEIVSFSYEDIITTSGGCSGDCSHICDNDCIEVCQGVCHIVT